MTDPTPSDLSLRLARIANEYSLCLDESGSLFHEMMERFEPGRRGAGRSHPCTPTEEPK